jgi:hypothetical protein
MDSPNIGDPMWNTMRLTLADLNHTTSQYGKNIDGYYHYNLNGEYFYWDEASGKYRKLEGLGDEPLFMGIKNEVPSLKYIDQLLEMPQYKDKMEAITTIWEIDYT